MDNCKKDERGSTIYSGLIILGIGLYFLAVNFEILPPVGESWPIILVVLGLSMIIGSFFKRKKTAETLSPPPPPPPPLK